MSSHQILLQAIDSLYATVPEVESAGITASQLPSEITQLMSHQIKTLNLLRDESVDIVINEAMTGDGKTLAAQLYPLLTPDTPALFMYPTNELISDQKMGLEKRLRVWPRQSFHPPNGLELYTLNADELDKLETSMSLGRADVISTPLKRDLVLTNPDIFHLLMQSQYFKPGEAPDQLLNFISGRFRLFVFDEFHLFSTPQVAAVMTAILLLRALSHHRPRFLFLSATPQNLLKAFATQIGLNVQHVEGAYVQASADTPTPSEYRRILQAVDLHLWSSNTLEDWMNNHVDIIRDFYKRQRPQGAKGVIIANSIATAHRLYEQLKCKLADDGITVGLNTGMIGFEERRISREADLIIGTSTIDVGVDFQINLLIFESTDAASHMQRLGRLGRHTSDNAGNPFTHYEAHAMLPSWIIAKVAEKIPNGETANRLDYANQIENAFSRKHTFNGYVKDWAGLQAAHVLSVLETDVIKNNYRKVVEELQSRYATLYGKSFRQRYYAMVKNDEERLLLNEAKSFRGDSLFTALVIDVSRGNSEPRAYNLLTLLRHGNIEELDLENVLNNLDEHQRHTLQRQKPLAAYRLRGWLPKPLRIRFHLGHRIEDWPNEDFGTARVQKGFSIKADGADGLYQLNKKIKDLQFVVTLVRNQKPEALRRRLRLDWQLALYEFESHDNLDGCVAFGRDALLLHTALKYSSVNPSGDSLLLF